MSLLGLRLTLEAALGILGLVFAMEALDLPGLCLKTVRLE